MSEFSI